MATEREYEAKASKPLYYVRIGASVGGLEALQGYRSMMDELLSRHTSMTIQAFFVRRGERL